MSRRLPSTPPNLPGFSFVRMLGSGGFADVFLYEQNMPRRLVAVKVLLAEVVDDQARRMFQAEADAMAQLSSHPSILTVYQASVAADGRPYLVMEFCPATLGQRYRTTSLPLAEVLAIGVRIASAVETAHRTGVLHRDIKPSNILTTAYGHPVLSDFGIAAKLGAHSASDAVGLSVPWSAPEVLVDDSGTIASEVWSLGATVYSLLAGRSPFEQPGGDNAVAKISSRIRTARVPRTGRDDVPESLELVLARSMSKRPSDRQSSALEFVRDLQSVEEELALPQTPLEVVTEDWALAVAVDFDERTRIVAAEPAVAADRRVRRTRRGPDRLAAATHRDESVPGATGVHPGPTRSTRRMLWAFSSIAVLLVGAALGGAYLVASSTSPIPVVTDVRAAIAGTTVTFSWDDPGLQGGDAYIVTVDGGARPVQRESRLDVAAADGEHLCASVAVTRDGKTGRSSEERCVDVDTEG